MTRSARKDRAPGLGVLALLALALAAACAPAAAPPTAAPSAAPGGSPPAYPVPPGTHLSRLLGVVPADLTPYALSPQVSDLALWYLDRAGEAEAVGLPLPRSQVERGAALQQRLVAESNLFTPLQTGLTPPADPVLWVDTFGYDPFGLQRSLLLTEDPTGLLFGVSIMEGDYDLEAVRERLRALGYAEERPGLFALFGEREIRQESPIIEATGSRSVMNRVALARDWIVAGNTESLVEALHTRMVAAARPASITGDPRMAGLLGALGEVHLALLLPPELVREVQARIGGYLRFSPPAEWGELHPYGWAGLGYHREAADQARFILALAYPDPDAAAADAEELHRRFQTYRPFSYPPRGEDPRQGAPPGESCPPEAPRVRSGPWGSVLSLSCDYNPTVSGHWWTMLLQTWDLDFLLPKPE
ncbi:MAG: hypothetical protein HY688_03410 [Chloroflexi bacterium]|nr:hypothetical protein [Chloroflexota bacterium]